ncbi:hypothetical protein PFISCL1PPCAC_28498, partial [Pristionchus fissidentatus]
GSKFLPTLSQVNSPSSLTPACPQPAAGRRLLQSSRIYTEEAERLQQLIGRLPGTTAELRPRVVVA